jgi:hypothetical protein
MKGLVVTVVAATCSLIGFSQSASAAWSAPGVPTTVDIVRGEGFMIYGSFGNGAGCSIGDQIFVQSDSPAYKEIFAAVLLAQSQGRAISLWIHSCVPRGWYAVPSTTFNTVSVNATLKLVQ